MYAGYIYIYLYYIYKLVIGGDDKHIYVQNSVVVKVLKTNLKQSI